MYIGICIRPFLHLEPSSKFMNAALPRRVRLAMRWQSLAIPELELSLERVLRCGQTFRWKCINNVWTFALDDRIVLLKQSRSHLQFAHVLRHAHIRAETTAEFIHDYFNLPVDLSSLYEYWESQHVLHHRKPTKLLPFKAFQGIRILRQDPWETTVSFICSSNNNVKRILKMCENLCINFGKHVGEYEGIAHYSFPAPRDLMEPHVESKLRELGFGYRARYIHQTACMMASDENPQISHARLNDMRGEDYDTAHDFLLQLTGVGPKVADCICLMALDKHDIVPVDTHVYQIAIREYKYHGNASIKTMNKAIYSGIRAYFKTVFGPYAGWAQLVLFASDLADLINGQNVSSAIKTENSNSSESKGELASIKHESQISLKSDSLPIAIVSSTEVKREPIDDFDVKALENTGPLNIESENGKSDVKNVKSEDDGAEAVKSSNESQRSKRPPQDFLETELRRSVRTKIKVE